MKRFTGKKTVLLWIMISAIALSGVLGCSRTSQKEGEKYFLYYIDKNKMKLVQTSYYTEENGTNQLIEELLSAMNETSSKLNYITAVPSLVNMLDWKLEDKVLYVNFDAGYLEMDRVREILCRSAVVLTVTQIPDVDYVNFSVKDTALADTNGKPIGNMKATDFVDNSGSTIHSYESRETVLYFANQTGEYLIPEKVSSLSSTNVSMEKFIIEQLQKGPSDKENKRTIPASVKLNSIFTKDGTCYVNFNETFLTEIPEVSADIEIASIVNSLCELSYVQKVQISVNGETNKTLRDKISLDSFFVRNLDLIIPKEIETEIEIEK